MRCARADHGESRKSFKNRRSRPVSVLDICLAKFAMAASFAIIPYFLSCTKMSKVQPAAISISAAEQETGLSKDVLRAWERRYGFPAPYRDAHGDRRYPAEQIRRLQLLRALIEMGDRPGKLMALTEAQLAGRLGARRRSAKLDVRPNAAVRIAVAECMDLLAVASSAQLEARLDAEMTRLGLERFAIEVVIGEKRDFMGLKV